MLEIRPAIVIAILSADVSIVQLLALVDGETTPRNAVAYPALSGPITAGDRVTLNTTATSLGLGTGGLDFVIADLSRPGPAVYGDSVGDEHIIKLRYTPHQHAVRTVEMDPEHASVLESAESLDSTPVVVGSLHSQIAPMAAAVKAANPDLRVAYIMTDSAALPLAFSRLVRQLADAGLIDSTLTCGQAFGGEYECVTYPSALIVARHIAHADVILVAPGPGNAGTGTRFGFSGIEQGPLVTVAGQLGGAPIGVLRLSSADPRARHRGVSHHSASALGGLAAPCRVGFPRSVEGIVEQELNEILAAVLDGQIGRRHEIVVVDSAPGVDLLEARHVPVRSMGRGVVDDPLFFHAASAAGRLAAEPHR